MRGTAACDPSGPKARPFTTSTCPRCSKSRKATSRGSAWWTARTTAVPFTEADNIDFSGAYLFSTWALTETTFETWDYYIERAAALAGAYVVGWRGFKDIPDQVWPWERLRDAFKTVRSDLTPYLDYDGDPTDSLELAAVNR